MPFTPFHLGPGALLKAAAPERVSLAAFAAAQVAIDVEPLVYLLRGEWPVHRWLHTEPGALAAGLLAGFAVHLAGRRIGARLPDEGPWSRRAELGLASALAGGALGGITHPLLDGLMHRDVRPFWPLVSGNPLLGLVPLGLLHAGCVAAGALAVAWLALRRRPLSLR